MKRKTPWIILTVLVVILLGVYIGGSWFFSSVAIDSPTQTLEDGRQESDSFVELGLPEPQDITIDAGEVTLAGFLFENPLDGDCGAILLHGFSGTRYGALQYAPLFWERGCDILAYDHRGHGASTPSLHTFGYYEKDDLVDALDWFTAQTGLDRSNVAVVGVSYGAATALQAAPLMPDVAFVLADSAYQDLASILRVQAEKQFGNLGLFLLPGALQMAELRIGGDVNTISPQDGVTQAQMPILLIHSLQDEYTPAGHSQTIFDRSNQSRTVLDLNDWGSPHGRDILTDYDTYRLEVDDFIDTYAPDFGLDVVP
jgi:pimeloyl-ACP methyl ester carboxylesterase